MFADHVEQWERATVQPHRLAAVRATGLVGGGRRDRFRRLAGLAARLVRAPVGLVSLVESDRDIWVGVVGVPDEIAAQGGTTVRPSFCQAIIATQGAPLAINDARADPIFREVPGVAMFGIVACLGVPVITRGGAALGSLCVYDFVPREWTADDVEALSALSDGVAAEFENATAQRGRWRARPRAGVTPAIESARPAPVALVDSERSTVVFNDAFASALSALEMFADLVMHDISVLGQESTTVSDMAGVIDGARSVARQVLTLTLRPPHARRPVDLSATVRSMERVLTLLAGGGRPLTFALAGGLPSVEMDPFDAERLVFVAVGHARRALHGQGGIIVTIDRDRPGGRFLLLTVEWRRPDWPSAAEEARDPGPDGAMAALADIVRRAEGLLVTTPSDTGGLLMAYLPIKG
jgi:hypothetical protein